MYVCSANIYSEFLVGRSDSQRFLPLLDQVCRSSKPWMRNESVSKRTMSTSPHYNLITTWFSFSGNCHKNRVQEAFATISQNHVNVNVPFPCDGRCLACGWGRRQPRWQSRTNRAATLGKTRNIQLYVALIEHASRCNSPSCTSQNCVKMKIYLKHSQSCNIKASGGCEILTLLLSYNKTLSWFHGNEEFLL